jgi:hypothetical protein
VAAAKRLEEGIVRVCDAGYMLRLFARPAKAAFDQAGVH